MFVKTNETGYLKDTKTGAIINTNDYDYQRILKERNQKKNSDKLCKKITDLETELASIRELLSKIVNKYE